MGLSAGGTRCSDVEMKSISASDRPGGSTGQRAESAIYDCLLMLQGTVGVGLSVEGAHRCDLEMSKSATEYTDSPGGSTGLPARGRSLLSTIAVYDRAVD